MDSRTHADDSELRNLAEQLLSVARNDPERCDMALDAYKSAVDRRRGELQHRIKGLNLDESIVTLDAAEALGIDVGTDLAPLAIATLRDLAREAPDGTTRQEARRLLEKYGLPLDDDEDPAG